MFEIPGITKEELEKAKKAATEDMIQDNGNTRKSKNKKSRTSIRKIPATN
jgi:hypothetical protein